MQIPTPPDPQPPVPPIDSPIPPIGEPEPDRLPDEVPKPNPDENDEPPLYSREDLADTYEISKQQAERLIERLGADEAEMDRFLAAKDRTSVHREEDVERTAQQVSLGR